MTFGLSGLFALESFIDGNPDGMVGLRGADNAFGAGKSDSGFEGRYLGDSFGFDELQLVQVADKRAPCRDSVDRRHGPGAV